MVLKICDVVDKLDRVQSKLSFINSLGHSELTDDTRDGFYFLLDDLEVKIKEANNGLRSCIKTAIQYPIAP